MAKHSTVWYPHVSINDCRSRRFSIPGVYHWHGSVLFPTDTFTIIVKKANTPHECINKMFNKVSARAGRASCLVGIGHTNEPPVRRRIQTVKEKCL